MKRLSKYFINGVLVIVPMGITILVIVKIFSLAESVLGRHLPAAIHFPGIGLIAVVILIVLVGWLSSYWLLKELLHWSDRLVGTIPVVKFIYSSVKKIATALFESQQRLQNAVLVPYPQPHTKALGFLMPELSAPLAEHFSEPHVCVFIPFSLNMTAGVNIVVAKKDIVPLDISGESALQYVLTAGAIMPDRNGKT